jgi:hypothetical protein
MALPSSLLCLSCGFIKRRFMQTKSCRFVPRNAGYFVEWMKEETPWRMSKTSESSPIKILKKYLFFAYRVRLQRHLQETKDRNHVFCDGFPFEKNREQADWTVAVLRSRNQPGTFRSHIASGHRDVVPLRCTLFSDPLIEPGEVAV